MTMKGHGNNHKHALLFVCSLEKSEGIFINMYKREFGDFTFS